MKPRAINRAHFVVNSNHRANEARQAVCGVGGASRDRTDDLLVANQTLSQLSYGPSPIKPTQHQRVVGLGVS